MTSVDLIRESYDETLYQGGAFSEGHPRSLNRAGIFAGLFPAQAAKCRVLEIGCAAGQNLMPMAESLPESRFLGLDLAPRNIQVAEEIRGKLGLENIEFRCQDILDFDVHEGPFDYIIAHGFYSWVPDHVRDRLMQIVGQSLAPQGVGYISYNTFPGWHLKRIARDLMLFHTRDVIGPKDRAAKGLEILGFTAQESPCAPGYREVMKAAAAAIPKQMNLLHDDMGVINDPVYFEDFVKHAQGHGLRYLGHAVPSWGIVSLPPAQQEHVRRLSSDPIVQEQYIDFLSGRAFRVSLLCRADAERSTPRVVDLVPQMHVSAWLKEDKAQAGVAFGGPWHFTLEKNKRPFALHEPRVCRAIRKIAAAWPRSVPVSELIAMEAASGGGQTSQTDGKPYSDLLSQTLYNMFEVELVELHTDSMDFIDGASGRLCASRLARLQAAKGQTITNLRHEGVQSNPVLSRILPLLDGERGRSGLLHEVSGMVNRQEISLSAPSGKSAETDLNNSLEQLLVFLANNSLLLT